MNSPEASDHMRRISLLYKSDSAIAQRIDWVLSDRFSHASKSFAHVADTESSQTMVWGEMRHVLSFLLYQNL